MSTKKFATLRLVLGDQLNPAHSWFRKKDEHVLYVIAELHQEMHYVKHHVQKICAFFAAMADFATALEKAGHKVLHLTLDDTAGKSLPGLLLHLIERFSVSRFDYQMPDEYRLLQQLREFDPSVEKHEWDSEHFYLPFGEIPDYFQAQKMQRMEMFYRRMRRRFNILMRGDEPESGRWNYDAENRHKLSNDDLREIPEPLVFVNDVSEILDRLARHKVPHFGRATEHLLWPVNRRQAKQLLDYFCRHCLGKFGRFQDAITTVVPVGWSLYHSRLSFAINSKMLSPRQVVDGALQVYKESPDRDTLAQVEGFVRQILGWREFVRGVYWSNMPAYASKNHLQAKRQLPGYFWHADTKMACMAAALGQSLDYAYAHHIQRLMVIGNFCLLTGINPDEVDAWYLGVYVDAIEWVEMPNTRGMSQFADAGLLASKPYASSGNYIHKMSDYCGGCHYQVKSKTGDHACPFNSLYWHFMDRHRQRFERNPRIGMVYKNWDRQSEDEKRGVLTRGEWCLKNIEKL